VAEPAGEAKGERRRLPAWTPGQERIAHVVIRVMSTLNIWAYRASGGRVGGRFRGGAPVCLVTTRGRKTGEPRVAPLLYLGDGERVVIVASKGGMARHPIWYLNLVAHPDCEVEIGRQRRAMRARTASPEEKAALWPRLVAMYRDYDDYQARTDRDIPVVILEPR
jgi:deazaflavin-dependent oxidoreductase (nitroreductase family)